MKSIKSMFPFRTPGTIESPSTAPTTELGFKPEYSVEDAIDQIAWLIDNGRVKDMSLAAFSNLHALRPYLCPEEIPLGREIRRPHSLSRHASPR